MLIKLLVHVIHFISAVLICGLSWIFIGKNKSIAIWNASIKMDRVISDGGEDEEILN